MCFQTEPYSDKGIYHLRGKDNSEENNINNFLFGKNMFFD